MRRGINFDSTPATGDIIGDVLEARLARYDETGAFAAARQWTLRRAVRGADPILEIGPGRGLTLDALTHVGARTVYCDASAHFAACNAHRGGGTVGDVRSLPYRNGAFGAVICERVLHHVDGCDDALDEIRRVTADRGVLLVSVPDHHTMTTPNAPAGFARFTAAAAAPGVVLAAPDAARRIEAATHRGWELADSTRFTIDDHDTIETYLRVSERIDLVEAAGLITADDAAALRDWWAAGDTGASLDIVAYELHATA